MLLESFVEAATKLRLLIYLAAFLYVLELLYHNSALSVIGEAAPKLYPFMYPTLPRVAYTLFRPLWLLPVIIFALFHLYFLPMFLFSILFHLFELSIYLVLSSLRDPILYNYGIYYKLCCPLGDFVSHDPSLATYFYMEVLLMLYPLITILSY